MFVVGYWYKSIRAQRRLSPLLFPLPISPPLFFAGNFWCCLFRILSHGFAQRSIKSGKVVVLLNGRYAGRKAVVVRAYESGNSGVSCVYGVCVPSLVAVAAVFA